MEEHRRSIRNLFSVASEVPDSEMEFLEMVYRSEFVTLTDQFSSGRLGKFESHSFMERIVQHALLAVPDPTVTVKNGQDGGSSWVSISAKWPEATLINVAQWRVVDARGVAKTGLTQRRASSSHFSETIPVGLTSRADVAVVFGVRSPSGTLASSPFGYRTRVGFDVDINFVDEMDPVEVEQTEFESYRYVPKKSRLPGLIRWTGIALVVGLFIRWVLEWL